MFIMKSTTPIVEALIVHSLCRIIYNVSIVAWAFKQVVSTGRDSIVLYCTFHLQTSRTCLVLSLLFGKFSAIRVALLPHSGLSLEPPVKCVYTFAVVTLS